MLHSEDYKDYNLYAYKNTSLNTGIAAGVNNERVYHPSKLRLPGGTY